MPRRDKNVRASAAKRQRLSAIAPDDFEDLDEAGWLEVPPPQGLPPGPSTADELQQWPLDLVRRLVGYNNGALKPLLEKSASYGSRNITDYSGFDLPAGDDLSSNKGDAARGLAISPSELCESVRQRQGSVGRPRLDQSSLGQ